MAINFYILLFTYKSMICNNGREFSIYIRNSRISFVIPIFAYSSFPPQGFATAPKIAENWKSVCGIWLQE